MEFPRQEYWSGLPFPTLGDFPNLGIETASLASPALAGGFFTNQATWRPFKGISEEIIIREELAYFVYRKVVFRLFYIYCVLEILLLISFTKFLLGYWFRQGT